MYRSTGPPVFCDFWACLVWGELLLFFSALMRQDTGLSFSQNASANIAPSHVERAERDLIPWKAPIPNAGCCTISYHDIQCYTIPPSQFSNGMKCWLHLWETLLRLHLWEILLNEALFQWFFDENKSWHAMSVCSMPERGGNQHHTRIWLHGRVFDNCVNRMNW